MVEAEFDQERLFNSINKFNFPRLAGTEGEKRAVELVYNTFLEIGFNSKQVRKQSFKFSDFYSTSLISLIGVMSTMFILVLLVFNYVFLFFKVIILGLMTLIVLLIIKGLKHPEFPGFWGKYYGTMRSATNVFVSIPAKSVSMEKAGNIVVSAHLDTKSQSLRHFGRILVYQIWIYGGIFFGGFYIARTIYLELFPFIELIFFTINIGIAEIDLLDLIIWVLALIVITSNIFLMLLSTHNKSPGALDNASGMAIVFELSRFFKDNPLNHFNLWFCQFSAEELGTMGSRFFTNEFEQRFLVKNKVFQFNFDVVSAAGSEKNRLEYIKSFGVFPRRYISPKLDKLLQRAAIEQNLKIYGFHLSTGAHTDTVPFHLRNFDAIDVVTRAAGKFTHSIEDTADKVDSKLLKEACIITRKAIQLLDEEF